MADSVREQILAQIGAMLAAISGVTVQRDAALPVVVPAGGLLVLRDDGDAPQWDLIGCDQFQMAATVEILDSSTEATTTLDALRGKVAQALLADRTLSGKAVDLWLDAMSDVTPIRVEGAAPMLGVSLTFAVLYWTAEGNPYQAAP